MAPEKATALQREAVFGSFLTTFFTVKCKLSMVICGINYTQKTAKNIKKQTSAKGRLGAHQQRPRTYKQTALNHQSRAKRPLDGSQKAVEGRLNQNQTGSQQPKVIGQQPAASSQQPTAASKQLASSCNTKQLPNRKQAARSNQTATNRERPAASSQSTQISSQ